MGTMTHSLNRQQTEAYIEVLNHAPDRLLPYAAAAALVLGTGARIGEVLQLRIRDIFDAELRPRERITRSIEKRRQEVRLAVPFPWERLGAPILRHLQRKIFKGQDQLFIDRDRRVCFNHQQQLLRMAGLPPVGVAFHGLRKTCLLRFHDAFARRWGETPTTWRKVQRLAGHSRIDTTLIYLDTDREGGADSDIRAAWQN